MNFKVRKLDLQYGDFACKVLDGFRADTCVCVRMTGARTDDKLRWIDCNQLLQFHYSKNRRQYRCLWSYKKDKSFAKYDLKRGENAPT